MLFVTGLFAKSCTLKNELCITPSVSTGGITLTLAVEPFTGYLAFGYGGSGMENQNMVVLEAVANGYSTSSYYSSSESTPSKVANKWKVTSSSPGKVVIQGTDSKYPVSGGQLVYAQGAINGGQLQKHTTVYGKFNVEGIATGLKIPKSLNFNHANGTNKTVANKPGKYSSNTVHLKTSFATSFIFGMYSFL